MAVVYESLLDLWAANMSTKPHHIAWALIAGLQGGEHVTDPWFLCNDDGEPLLYPDLWEDIGWDNAQGGTFGVFTTTGSFRVTIERL